MPPFLASPWLGTDMGALNPIFAIVIAAAPSCAPYLQLRQNFIDPSSDNEDAASECYGYGADGHGLNIDT